MITGNISITMEAVKSKHNRRIIIDTIERIIPFQQLTNIKVGTKQTHQNAYSYKYIKMYQ